MVFMFWMLAWLEQHGLGEKKKKKTRETRKGVLWTSKGKDAALFKREERTLSVCFKMFSLG